LAWGVGGSGSGHDHDHLVHGVQDYAHSMHPFPYPQEPVADPRFG
jgi:hypothetical protein